MNGTEVNPRYSENALKEKAFLQELNKKPPLQKFFGYCKLSGPGFMNAAFTLGAGSFASSVTLGAAYGYDMLWIPLYSFALGLFMLALATRFVTASEISVIKAQDKFHGKFFGSFATGLVACFVASIVYNFGQYALGADAVTALFSVVNINVPKNISWILLVAISVPLSLMYGSGDNPKGVKIVENAMKILIGIMLVVFGAVLCVTGVDFKAMIKGLLIPTLPSGIDGIVMLLLYGALMWYTIHTTKRPEATAPDAGAKPGMAGWLMAAMIVGGLAGLIFGGEMFLRSATEIARRLGISESVIAITLVAGGTSLPELASSLVSLFKGKADMALGNVIGSNIANILLILGLSATIHPLSMDGITVWDLLMVVLSSVLLFLAAFTFKRRAIDRWEGAIFLAIYVAYIGYLIR